MDELIERKPPTLEDFKLREAESKHAISVSTRVENESRRALIAEAQRDADIKWFQDWLKEEVGNMEVMDEDEIREVCGITYKSIATPVNYFIAVQAQRNKDKKSLLDKIEKETK